MIAIRSRIKTGRRMRGAREAARETGRTIGPPGSRREAQRDPACARVPFPRRTLHPHPSPEIRVDLLHALDEILAADPAP
ncbi:MAG: hypothetical protein RQ745_12975, partial [Longimicrobiales bacterium]|nr:hypothetical protein [Longimicrobiales bacterium]